MGKLILAGGLWLGLASLFLPAVQWRVRALTLKASGQAPEWPWEDVLVGMAPGSYRGQLLEDRFRGDARFVRRISEDSCPVLWDTALGSFWAQMVDHDYVSWHVRRMDKLFAVHEDVPRARPGDVVLEIGGWVGCFTRQCLIDGAERIVALEPEPSNIDCFRKNLGAALRDGRVELVEKAAWSHSGGTVRFGLPEIDPEGNPQVSPEGFMPMEDGPVEVEVVTIDDLVRERGLERVDLIQMDVEGAERHALAGARETLRRFAPDLILCLHHLPDDFEVLTGMMREINPTYRRTGDDLHGFFIGARPFSGDESLPE
ncbi:MAG: FkbM family methyltransferase [Acidobacteria bacterium]|nr:FkbM family methyltransferase [Acidobacteriota bacterium]